MSPCSSKAAGYGILFPTAKISFIADFSVFFFTCTRSFIESGNLSVSIISFFSAMTVPFLSIISSFTSLSISGYNPYTGTLCQFSSVTIFSQISASFVFPFTINCTAQGSSVQNITYAQSGVLPYGFKITHGSSNKYLFSFNCFVNS